MTLLVCRSINSALPEAMCNLELSRGDEVLSVAAAIEGAAVPVRTKNRLKIER